jgi:hypothetical protein
MERRWGQRISVRIPVLAQLGTRALFRAHLENISLSGAYMAVPRPITCDGTCFVRWASNQVSVDERPPVMGHIVRWTADGLGIEWAEFAPRPVWLLLQCVPAPVEPSQAHMLWELARERCDLPDWGSSAATSPSGKPYP